MKIDITELTQLTEFAKEFAKNLKKGDIIFLQGDLGSGKTTFTQILLKQLGYNKRVKSPTYALYETYSLAELNVIHMDLYRLASPEELYYLAIDEIFDVENTVIIEWPENGNKVLPAATRVLKFKLKDLHERTIVVR
ncbi:MAG: tRNA (adenosine(37)-N6)-threonylcarbamoyltransferase complex ATPase subunit type 1 TsaE [Proteobacteria bacterium]|nr:tRNA (adenosine(37)-N6)-threonylcarbamoyltransferase complex ATPase subunit type 1 TsaE [Pseudomonadota bacterium]